MKEEIHLKILRVLEDNPDLTQRELAVRLNISVGSLNYCLTALIDKGFIKMANFKKSKNKFKYVYILTPKGFSQKVALARRFLQHKLQEYEALKVEIDILKTESAKKLHVRN